MPRLLRSATYFPVHDVARTIAYYGDVLGFDCEYSAGSPPVFAICVRDDQRIMLRLVGEADRVVPNEAQGGTWDAFFWVDNADALHDELSRRGATVVYGPIVQEAYHMREFAVRDCDGHVLGFGHRVQ